MLFFDSELIAEFRNYLRFQTVNVFIDKWKVIYIFENVVMKEVRSGTWTLAKNLCIYRDSIQKVRIAGAAFGWARTGIDSNAEHHYVSPFG